MTSRPEILAKRITPTLLLLLALGGALVMAAPRPAGASPCKPDGQACRTNQSCCGTNGHNGLCVNSNPPGKRPAGACCTPTTCEAAGAHCGMIPDGTCLTLAPLNCGTCPSGQICGTGNVCESTTTTTTTSTTSTTTTQPMCGTTFAFHCTFADGVMCDLAGTGCGGSFPDCDTDRAVCVAFGDANDGGAGNCTTTPCTQGCFGGPPCQ